MLNIKIFKKIIKISAALAMFASAVSCVGAKGNVSSTSKAKTKTIATVAKKDTKKQDSKKSKEVSNKFEESFVVAPLKKSNTKVYAPTARIVQKALADSIVNKFKDFLNSCKDLGVNTKKIKELNLNNFISFKKLSFDNVKLDDVFEIKFKLNDASLDSKTKEVLGLAFVGLLNKLRESKYFDKDGNLELHKILNSATFNSYLDHNFEAYSKAVKKEYSDSGKKLDEKKLTKKDVKNIVNLTKDLKLAFGNNLGKSNTGKSGKNVEEKSNLEKVLSEIK